MGYPVHDHAMSVLGSETRECSEKSSPPRAIDVDNQREEVRVAWTGYDLGVAGAAAIAGRYANSRMAKRASAMPVLLYPPERPLTKGHTARIVNKLIIHTSTRR